ncbi:EZY7 [Auxenochlorella protothecoides x Auxenochlorella symbiontica]
MISSNTPSPDRKVGRYDPIGHNPRNDRAGGGQRSEDEQDLQNFIKISSREEPKHYASKIAWNARGDRHMPLIATGAPAINIAIKAVAIARKYLEKDELELMCQPAFRDRKMGASLALYLSSVPAAELSSTLNSEFGELTVGKNSKPQTVAGAIAGRARDGTGVVVTSIGPDAVCNACVATCHARIYLEDDKIDVRAIPIFEEVEKTSVDGSMHTMTALKLKVLIEGVQDS